MGKLAKRKSLPARRRRRARRLAGIVVRRARGAVRSAPKKDLIGPLMSGAAGVGFALVDAKKPQYSEIKGVPMPLIYGIAAVFAGTMVKQLSGGTVGQVLRETGSAGLTLGAYKATLKKMGPAVSGDEVGYQEE